MSARLAILYSSSSGIHTQLNWRLLKSVSQAYRKSVNNIHSMLLEQVKKQVFPEKVHKIIERIFVLQ